MDLRPLSVSGKCGRGDMANKVAGNNQGAALCMVAGMEAHRTGLRRQRALGGPDPGKDGADLPDIENWVSSEDAPCPKGRDLSFHRAVVDAPVDRCAQERSRMTASAWRDRPRQRQGRSSGN